MATLIAPGGSVCEVGDDVALIAALKSDGWTVQGEKKQPEKKASPRKSQK